MTAEEHAHTQELEGLVKRYRSRIVALKALLEQARVCQACGQPTTGLPERQGLCEACYAETFVRRIGMPV